MTTPPQKFRFQPAAAPTGDAAAAVDPTPVPPPPLHAARPTPPPRPRKKELSLEAINKALQAFEEPESAAAAKQSLLLVAEGTGLEIAAFPVRIPDEVADLLTPEQAWRYLVIPFNLQMFGKRKELRIATANPGDLASQDDVQHLLSGYDVVWCVTTEAELSRLFALYYTAPDSTMDDLVTELSNDALQDQVSELLKRIAGQEQVVLAYASQAVRYVQQLLRYAVARRASDIHIEPERQGCRIRLRIDGELIFLEDCVPKCPEGFRRSPKTNQLRRAVAAYLKGLAQLDVTKTWEPQDGRIMVRLDAHTQVQLRFSSLPSTKGESIVLRLMGSGTQFPSLEELGYPLEIQRRLERVHIDHHGILVTGPTGSGKTTTLYTILGLLNGPERKIVTIEDPIEKEVPGLIQTQTNPNARRKNKPDDPGFSFAAALRAQLRQAPEIILVGEIRDLETAEAAISAAMTGHVVFSTLHTNDATSAYVRLADMGVPVENAVDGFTAVLAQRLLRRLCPKCRTAVAWTAVAPAVRGAIEVHRGFVAPEEVWHPGAGCTSCQKRGYHGRTAVGELLETTSTLREVARTQRSATVLRRAAIADKMATLHDDAWQRVLGGVTTPEEFVDILGPWETPDIKKSNELRIGGRRVSPRELADLLGVLQKLIAHDQHPESAPTPPSTTQTMLRLMTLARSTQGTPPADPSSI